MYGGLSLSSTSRESRYKSGQHSPLQMPCNRYVGYMSKSTSRSAASPGSTSAVRTDGRQTRSQRNLPLAQVVKQRLLDDIMEGVHAPGTMLSLAKLAEAYGVSRTPVREALSILEHDGLVTSFPYQGFLVNSASIGDLKDLYLMREVIETKTAQRAAERATPEAAAELRSLVPAEMPKDTTYTPTFDTNARDFHGTVARMSDSPRLASAVSDIFQSAARLQFIGMNPPSPKLIVEDHRLIAEAIADKDPGAAARLMHQHILDLRTHALEALLR